MIQGLITFNGGGTVPLHIYRHQNAHPVGVATVMTNAFGRSYPPSKYEPGDLAAAFVAYSKASAGDVRIVGSGDWRQVSPSEARFRYVVSVVSEEYWIAAYAVFYDEPTNQWYERLLYDGACAQFGAWAAKEQAGQ